MINKNQIRDQKKALTGKIGEQSSTRTLRNIISNIKNPKPEHKNSNRKRPIALANIIPYQPANIGRVTDYNNRNDDRRRTD